MAYTVNLEPLNKFNSDVLRHQLPNYLLSSIEEFVRYFKPNMSTTIKDDITKDLKFPGQAHWTTNTFMGEKSFTPPISLSTVPNKLPSLRLDNFFTKYYQLIFMPNIILGLGSILSLVSFIIKRNTYSEISITFILFAAIQLLVTSAAASLNYRYFIPLKELFWLGTIFAILALVKGKNIKKHA